MTTAPDAAEPQAAGDTLFTAQFVVVANRPAVELVGVIAPKVNVIAGVVLELATTPETPFAVVTDMPVTVPLEAADA